MPGCRGTPGGLSRSCVPGMLHGRHTVERHGGSEDLLGWAACKPALQNCLVSQVPSHGPFFQHTLLLCRSTSPQADSELVCQVGVARLQQQSQLCSQTASIIACHAIFSRGPCQCPRAQVWRWKRMGEQQGDKR